MDAAQMTATEIKLKALTAGQINPGPLKGLLLGDPQRFINDLVMQLRLRATLEEFHRAVFDRPIDKTQVVSRFAEFIAAAATWQKQHNYKNNWSWPRMEEALRKLGDATVDAALDARNYKGDGKTPFEKVQNGFYKVETYTPRLIEAMKQALNVMK